MPHPLTRRLDAAETALVANTEAEPTFSNEDLDAILARIIDGDGADEQAEPTAEQIREGEAWLGEFLRDARGRSHSG